MPIEVPDVARLGPSSAELPGKVSAELQAPVSDAFMGDHDATLGQDQLHIPQAQAEYMVQPYSVADDLGRKAIAGIGGEVGRHPASLARPYRFGQRASTWQCPFDGHTLAAQIVQTERITGVEIERAYVDRGYRGHDADKTRVFISGQKRGITPTIRRERRRRSAIEPVIGHLKSDGRLGRNFLLGIAGDATNLILAAAGHNLRLLRAWLARLLAFLLSRLATAHQIAEARRPRSLAA